MRTLAPLLMSIVLAATAAAGNAEDATLAKIRTVLAERFPKAHISEVRAAAMPGLYEVINDGEIAYSDASGEFLLTGQLMETKTMRNLTRARLEEVNAIDFKTLPLDLAIKTVRGTGKRQLAVFADPDCPYCQELETQLAGLSDITIYTFLFPLDDLHPDAAHKAQILWCAKDRSAAWSTWMLKREMTGDASCPAGPFKTIAELATKLRINSTPTSFLANGRRISGARKQDQLEKFLSSVSAN